MTNLMRDVLLLPTQSPNPEQTEQATEQATEQPTEQPEETSSFVLQPIGTPAPLDEAALNAKKPASKGISPYVWVIAAAVAAAAVAAVLLAILSKKKKKK